MILLVLYFLQFYLTSLRGKEYFAKLSQFANSQEPEPEPGFFGPLEPEQEPLEKKIPGAEARVGAAWEKDQEPEPSKNLPAPQP